MALMLGVLRDSAALSREGRFMWAEVGGRSTPARIRAAGDSDRTRQRAHCSLARKAGFASPCMGG